MKKILGLTVAALLVMGLVGGGTWAYFSDPETSTGNTFAAGTLELEVNDAEQWASTVISTGTMKPGDSGSVSIKLDNSGSINGTVLNAYILNLSNNDGTFTEPEVVDEGGTWNGGSPTGRTQVYLSSKMQMVVFVDNGAGGGTANNGIKDGSEATLASGNLSSINGTGPWTVSGGLSAGGTTYIGISYNIDGPSVFNEIQGDTAQFDIKFELLQQ
jgi:predicted ribosomally synthesized peptide with SipW-like signal peptide